MSLVPIGVPDEMSDPAGKRNPFPWFRRMRESDPVRFDPSRETWDVFTYEHVNEVLSNDEVYSIDVRLSVGQEDPLAESMMFSDPPRHDFLQEAVTPFFAPATLDDYESRIRTEAVSRIEAGLDDGRLDVVNDLGFPVAATTVGTLLGVPPADHDHFVALASKSLHGREPDGTPVENPATCWHELLDYVSELVTDRRNDPRDDLVSHLLETDVDGRSLTHEDVVGFCEMMLVGGAVPATLIANAVYSFEQVDGLVERLADDADALEAAIEESLRYRSSTQALPRLVRTDAELGGRQLEAGDRVVAWVASANRDSAVFDRPESFVLDRDGNDHLTFGEGIHYCIGSRIARMEARVVLSELLDRVASIEIHEADLEPRVNPIEFGFESLPIRFDPSRT